LFPYGMIAVESAQELVLLDLTRANFDERTIAETTTFALERSPNHGRGEGHPWVAGPPKGAPHLVRSLALLVDGRAGDGGLDPVLHHMRRLAGVL
jgi:hypothetical protein